MVHMQGLGNYLQSGYSAHAGFEALPKTLGVAHTQDSEGLARLIEVAGVDIWGRVISTSSETGKHR